MTKSEARAIKQRIDAAIEHLDSIIESLYVERGTTIQEAVAVMEAARVELRRVQDLVGEEL